MDIKSPFDVWPKKWVYSIMSRNTYNVKRRLDPFTPLHDLKR